MKEVKVTKNIIDLYNEIAAIPTEIPIDPTSIVNTTIKEVLNYKKGLDICKEQEFTKRYVARKQVEAIIEYKRNKRELIESAWKEDKINRDLLVCEFIELLHSDLKEEDTYKLAFILKYLAQSDLQRYLDNY